MLKIIFNLLYGILGIFKRLMCFLNIKRRRKTSGSLLPMHSQLPSSGNVTQSIPSNDIELESWDAWGQEQNKTQSNNSRYGNHNENDTQEEDVDFFTDMTPHFKKATKILVRKKEETNDVHSGFSNRLTVQSNAPINQGPDLEAWEESENAWAAEANEDLSWEAHATLKEKRRLEREERQAEQLRKKHERDAQRSQHRIPAHLAAVKLK